IGASSVSQPATGFWAETAAGSFRGANAARGALAYHRHRRCTCTKDERCGNCDHGLGRHRRGSYFEMSLSAIEFAQMRREVTCLEFTTTCSTRCHVWTNESCARPTKLRPARRSAASTAKYPVE